MPLLLAVLFAILALAAAGGATGSPPDASPSVRSSPARPSADPSYLFHATFALRYAIQWFELSGSRPPRAQRGARTRA